MAFKSNVVVRTQFAGMHCWATCPHDEVSFLKNDHRHIFFVEVKIPVSHDDRDIEFFMLKEAVNNAIDYLYPVVHDIAILGSRSCEMVAQEIIMVLAEEFPADKIICSVFEDAENGGEVTWTVD